MGMEYSLDLVQIRVGGFDGDGVVGGGREGLEVVCGGCLGEGGMNDCGMRHDHEDANS